MFAKLNAGLLAAAGGNTSADWEGLFADQPETESMQVRTPASLRPLALGDAHPVRLRWKGCTCEVAR
eukprot:4440759-Pyramimonas_sp.AAC.1